LNQIYNKVDGSHEIGFLKFKKRFKILQILLNNKLFNNVLIDNYKNKKKIKKKYMWKPFNMLWLWIFKDPIVEKVINYMVVKGLKEKSEIIFF